MIKAIKYRKDIELFDIVTVAGCKYIAIEISYEAIVLENLASWIMRNSFLCIPEAENETITIADYVRMKEENFLKDRDKGLVVHPSDVTAW